MDRAVQTFALDAMEMHNRLQAMEATMKAMDARLSALSTQGDTLPRMEKIKHAGCIVMTYLTYLTYLTYVSYIISNTYSVLKLNLQGPGDRFLCYMLLQSQVSSLPLLR